jgi:hypothetical protein
VTPRPARRGDQRHRKPVYQLLRRAPSRTRTDTGRILSPLPLPIGLWGRCSSEHHLSLFGLVRRSRLQTRYRSAVDRLTQRIGHTGQIIVEAMAVSVERHRSCRVPQESLHNLDVSACTDRQGRRGVPQAVRYQPFDPYIIARVVERCACVGPNRPESGIRPIVSPVVGQIRSDGERFTN